MDVLSLIKKNVINHPNSIAVISRDKNLTYKELWEKSDLLACWLNINAEENKPIAVYGHKDPNMLVAFLGCAKSGRAYCPIDFSMPADRTLDIIQTLDNDLILSTMELEVEGRSVYDVQKILDDLNDYSINEDLQSNWVKPDDLFYMIFTSGSTGKPKGVEITADNLYNFVLWSSELGDKTEEKDECIFIDQAPWSFDLSVMDTYTSLACGGALFTLDKEMQNNIKELFDFLSKSRANYWISTPSFVDMCLADKSFNFEMMPELKSFLFCGERLTNKTATTLIERFPNCKIFNTYGPTEATVAVTSVEITKEIVSSQRLLPVGKVKDGTEIVIVKDGKILDKGESGEIVICGNTVGKGYFKEPEKTSKVFKTFDVNGKNMNAYFTGDEGFYKNDMVYCVGRLDFQIKLHGYRIELGDIEEKLLLNPEITSAVVIPKWEDEKVKHLVAFVVKENYDGTFAQRKEIKTKLGELLPSYMVPKTIKVIDNMPKTNNGKVDRKKLAEEL